MADTKTRKKAVRRVVNYIIHCDDKGFVMDGLEFSHKVEDALVFETRQKADSYANGLKRFFQAYKMVVLQRLIDRQ